MDLTVWNHSKCKSPVRSNSTVGMTLVMNLRKIRSAKCDYTFCPFSRMASDMLFSTVACLQGCTVGMEMLSMKLKGSMVRVLSRYSFWMSSFILSFSTGFPPKSVALKNILGV